jgi:hypothetical protein
MLNSLPRVSRMVHQPKDIQPTWHNCGNHSSHLGPASLWNAFDTLLIPCPMYWGCSEECVLNVLYTQCILFLDIAQEYSNNTRVISFRGASHFIISVSDQFHHLKHKTIWPFINVQ